MIPELDSQDASFLVRMTSLTDFTRELETQLDGLAKPVGELAGVAAAPLLLGNFAEAHGLVAAHDAVATEMGDLLGQVRMAIAFASEVTKIVGDRYTEADRVVGDALGMDV